jgi:hypothetical protein
VRRAVLILVASLAALLAAVPVAPAAEAPIREASFELHADGFLVGVKNEVGEEKVVLTLDRHGQVAYYEAPAEIGDDTMKARFGQFGELDYEFTPGPKTKPCVGPREGTFRGTFDFTGENGYVQIEADHVHGSFEGGPVKGCKESPGPPIPPPTIVHASGSRVTAVTRLANDEATLAASDSRRPPLHSLLVFDIATKKGTRTYFYGFQDERLEGMLIARGAEVPAPASTFRFDLDAGTARVDPPAPFRGSATFTRRPGARAVWRGSLTVPVLGEGRVRLAGPAFTARLDAGSPID